MLSNHLEGGGGGGGYIYILNLVPLQCSKITSFPDAYLIIQNEWMGTEWCDQSAQSLVVHLLFYSSRL